MSHSKERKEKDCLNCGSAVFGRYCHVCGQENKEPKETAWHMVMHFFEDITHFDGKFFMSVKYLLTRPGFMATEYMAGRRMSYLNPVRMYVFSSALFFVLLFTFFLKPAQYNAQVAHIRDTVEQNNNYEDAQLLFESSSYPGMEKNVVTLHFNKNYAIRGSAAYDSIQASLPKDKRDNSILRYYNRKFAIAASIYHKDPNDFIEKSTERFYHSIPRIFFVSLPLFAFIAQLLYRRRKQYYFGAHAVFSIHFYCIVFLFTLMLCVLTDLHEVFDNVILYTTVEILGIAIVPGIFLYLYIAMKNFYKQGWLKTFGKFLILGTLYTVILISLVISFYISSIT